MTAISPLKVGCGKFFHGKGVLSFLPSEIQRLGNKALIIGGPTALECFLSAARKDLDASDIAYEIITHHGQCTIQKAEEFAGIAQELGCTVLVGVGGGKCIDNVKCASVFSDLPIITVPTSIATCVATSIVAIMYNDAGQRQPSVNLKKEVDVCIADTNLIGTAPKRTLASGIMDSIAKYPECFHLKSASNYRECDLKEYIQIINAKGIYEFLTGEYKDLYDNGINAAHFEDAILTNLLHTSIVSGFADGSGQLAIAHATYDFIRNYHTKPGLVFLHGELVAVGLLIQMAFNGMPREEIQKVRSAMCYMNMPLTLRDLGYDTSEEGLRFFLDKIAGDTHITSDDEFMRLKSALSEVL